MLQLMLLALAQGSRLTDRWCSEDFSLEAKDVERNGPGGRWREQSDVWVAAEGCKLGTFDGSFSRICSDMSELPVLWGS